jgi:hypothetical protein
MNARETTLLRRLQLCRADFVAAMGDSSLPPSPLSLRSLADLQLSIMAIEAAVANRSNPQFDLEFRMEFAA